MHERKRRFHQEREQMPARTVQKKRKNIQGRLKGPAAGRLPSAVMIRRPGAFFDAERY
jgi:hypothetical protein